MDINYLESILMIPALIFFILLCLLGIIAIFVIISAVRKISKKVEELSDNAQEVLNNGSRITDGLVGFFDTFSTKKQSPILKIISYFLKK